MDFTAGFASVRQILACGTAASWGWAHPAVDRLPFPANLALSGVAPTPVRATAAEDMLRGQSPTADLIRRAATAAAQADDVDPESDVMASAGYRRAMAEVYSRRALTEAAERAKPGR